MRRLPNPRNLAGILFDVLGGVLVFSALAAALYYWDPSRVLLKRLTAPDPYLYEVVEPRFAAIDPAEFVKVRDREGTRGNPRPPHQCPVGVRRVSGKSASRRSPAAVGGE